MEAAEWEEERSSHAITYEALTKRQVSKPKPTSLPKEFSSAPKVGGIQAEWGPRDSAWDKEPRQSLGLLAGLPLPAGTGEPQAKSSWLPPQIYN